MIRICKEESFHQRQGFQIMLELSNGTPEQQAMAQGALDRWWWPSIMMFGPPDAESVHGDQNMRWGIKRFGNDELRQKFIDATVPQADLLGLTIPDPDLHLDEETGHYVHGPIDWDHFWDVVKGNGPCNRSRTETRVGAHERGTWVRAAATAYADKQAARAADVQEPAA
jgi:ring-1,2-phenylacetyl-CoA epoxidase subunit PaaA